MSESHSSLRFHFVDRARAWYQRSSEGAKNSGRSAEFDIAFKRCRDSVTRLQKFVDLDLVQEGEVSEGLVAASRGLESRLNRLSTSGKVEEVREALDATSDLIESDLTRLAPRLAQRVEDHLAAVSSVLQGTKSQLIDVETQAKSLLGVASKAAEATSSAREEAANAARATKREQVSASRAADKLGKLLGVGQKELSSARATWKAVKEHETDLLALRRTWNEQSTSLDEATKRALDSIPETEGRIQGVLTQAERAADRAVKILYESETARLAQHWSVQREKEEKERSALQWFLVATLLVISGLTGAAIWLRIGGKLQLTELFAAKMFVVTPIALIGVYLSRRIGLLQKKINLLDRKIAVAATLEPYREFAMKLAWESTEVQRADANRFFLDTVGKLYDLSLSDPDHPVGHVGPELPAEVREIEKWVTLAERHGGKRLDEAERLMKLAKELKNLPTSAVVEALQTEVSRPS